MEPDLHSGLEQGLRVAVLPLDHDADAVEPAHLDRLEDPLVVGRPIAVVVAGDHQHAALVSLRGGHPSLMIADESAGRAPQSAQSTCWIAERISESWKPESGFCPLGPWTRMDGVPVEARGWA